VVSLDKHYKFVDQMEERFPKGPPSLIQCDKFTVKGDFIFGSRITCRGEAEIVNLSGKQGRVPDGALLSGKEEI
jgi:UTP--glucose-1-phosphate uridylyltransferase